MTTKAKTIPEVELIFDLVMKQGGYDYSEMTKSAIWAEANRNAKLRNLALLYLVADSHRAELMRERLRAEIEAVFFTSPEN
jgi:hypothetical protein